jgi:CubicO group peptidase (beta-lactamase class C family)
MRLLRRSVVVFAAAGVALPLPAQRPVAGAVLDSISHFIAHELARQHIPGLSLVILQGDSVVLSRGWGESNVELYVPASDSTIYQSGSMGKQFTAAGVELLAQDGKLSFADPILKWIPEGPAAWQGITIRQLLTHTSGIADYTDSTLDLRRDYTEADLVRLAAVKALDFRPGERWSYSNTGYLLLGIIIHRVSGQFYGDFLHDRVFTPVGMRTTRVISEADIVPNRAAGYVWAGDRLKNQEWVSPTLNTTADGALYFTVRDLAQWAIALNHGRVPSRTGLDSAWLPARLNDGSVYPYGFGWSLVPQRGLRRIGHSGAWQGFRTAIMRYPDFDLTIAALANLEQAKPELIVAAVAGILHPELTPPYLLKAPLPGPAAPTSIADVLRGVADSTDARVATPGLRRFLTADDRHFIGGLLQHAGDLTPLGCDAVGTKGIVRLDARIERICYASTQVVTEGERLTRIVTIWFTTDGKVAGVDTYTW